MSLLSALVPLLRVYCIGLRVILHQLRRRFQPRCAPASGEHRSRRRGAGQGGSGPGGGSPRRGKGKVCRASPHPPQAGGSSGALGPRPRGPAGSGRTVKRTGQGSRDLGCSAGRPGRAASPAAEQGLRYSGGPGTGAAAGLLPCSPSPAEQDPLRPPRAAAPGGLRLAGRRPRPRRTPP